MAFRLEYPDTRICIPSREVDRDACSLHYSAVKNTRCFNIKSIIEFSLYSTFLRPITTSSCKDTLSWLTLNLRLPNNTTRLFWLGLHQRNSFYFALARRKNDTMTTIGTC